jgi:hypothetical protein
MIARLEKRGREKEIEREEVRKGEGEKVRKRGGGGR